MLLLKMSDNFLLYWLFNFGFKCGFLDFLVGNLNKIEWINVWIVDLLVLFLLNILVNWWLNLILCWINWLYLYIFNDLIIILFIFYFIF